MACGGRHVQVMIYRLVTRATVEERMMQMTRKKMVLEHVVVGKMKAPGQAQQQGLNQEELDDILRYGSKELFGEADDEEDEDDEEGEEVRGKAQAEEGKAQAEDGKAQAEEGKEAAAEQGGKARKSRPKTKRIHYNDQAIDRCDGPSKESTPMINPLIGTMGPQPPAYGMQEPKGSCRLSSGQVERAGGGVLWSWPHAWCCWKGASCCIPCAA